MAATGDQVQAVEDAGPAHVEPATEDDALDDNDDLTLEAILRAGLRRPEPTPADLQRQFEQADLWRACPIPQERLELVNELAARFYQDCYQHSWSRAYLADRFGEDVRDHPDLRPGHAPNDWTALTHHLASQGITAKEMITAGVAQHTRDGRLIDRFRDRVILPILDPTNHVLGFVGRRNPTSTDERAPKYLNTPDTPLFHKGSQLYGAFGHLLANPHSIPVLAEGPFDAHAITLVTHGQYVGVAPLGTSLTSLQATQLADLGRTPIVATDADLAGRLAAERDYWLLTPHGLDPAYAHLPAGADPADLLAQGRTHTLTQALHTASPLADLLITERLTNLPTAQAALESVAVLAAQPGPHWEPGLQTLASHLDVPASFLRGALKDHVRAWNTDARKAAANQISRLRDVKQRLDQSADHHETPTSPTAPPPPIERIPTPSASRGRRGPSRGR